MTTPITKEQLQRIIESADDVLSAMAGTNEDVHPESDDMIRLWDYLNDVAAPPAVVKRLSEFTQAAMDAEPVYQWRERYEEGILWDDCTKAQYDGFAKNPECETRVLYTAPPAPVVIDTKPSLKAMMQALDAFYGNEDVPEQGMMLAFRILLNDCRAAMLQGDKS